MSVKIKVIIIGDADVGKTSLAHICRQGTELSIAVPTAAVDVTKKVFKFDYKNIMVDIWDTAGAEKYRGLTSTYYRGAHAIFIVYDITNRKTFESLKSWLDECKASDISDCATIVLLGNKKDLEKDRKVTTEDGQKFAKEHNLKFYETFKSDPNLEKVFVTELEQILRNENLKTNSDNISIADKEQLQQSTCNNNTIQFNLSLFKKWA